MPAAAAAERSCFPQGLAIPAAFSLAFLAGGGGGGEQGEGRRGGRRPPQLGQGAAPGWEVDLDAVPPDEPVEHVYGGSLGVRVVDAQVAQVGVGVAGQALAGLKPGTAQLAVQLSAPVTI